mgnify:CR=1 FL=1
MRQTKTDQTKCVTKASLLEKIALLMALKKPNNEHIKLYVLDFYFDSEPIAA